MEKLSVPSRLRLALDLVEQMQREIQNGSKDDWECTLSQMYQVIRSLPLDLLLRGEKIDVEVQELTQISRTKITTSLRSITLNLELGLNILSIPYRDPEGTESKTAHSEKIKCKNLPIHQFSDLKQLHPQLMGWSLVVEKLSREKCSAWVSESPSGKLDACLLWEQRVLQDEMQSICVLDLINDPNAPLHNIPFIRTFLQENVLQNTLYTSVTMAVRESRTKLIETLQECDFKPDRVCPLSRDHFTCKKGNEDAIRFRFFPDQTKSPQEVTERAAVLH